MNTRSKKAAVIGLGVVALGASIYGINGLNSAEIATSPEQRVLFEAGAFTIDIVPNTSRDWAVDIPPLAAGDHITNYVDLVNRSDVPIGQLKVVGNPSGELLEGPSPVVIKMTGCSTPFTKEGECLGTSVKMISDVVKDDSEDVTTLLDAGDRLYLQVSTVIPRNAGNEYQGKSGAVSYKFTAIQKQIDEKPRPVR